MDFVEFDDVNFDNDFECPACGYVGDYLSFTSEGDGLMCPECGVVSCGGDFEAVSAGGGD